ncbi:hypothetical protein [Actinoplanes italicus]|nr:hypothetical protein [Actinoplanes italicus]
MVRELGDPETLARAGDAAEAAGERVRPQGFNARPQRRAGRYVLGALSEHALGRAVDIRPGTNPQITVPVWQYLPDVTGMRVDRSEQRWRDDPGGLFDDLAELERRWFAFLAVRRPARRFADRQAGSLTGLPTAPEPGDRWGLTFGTPDIHHFELP